MKVLSIARSALTAVAVTICAQNASAQDYPTRPVRIVVPYAAGGPSDTGTRLVVEPLSRQLGQPIVIENRGGAGGLSATEVFLAGPQDGYTILVGAIGPLTIIPALKQVSYVAEKDFVPLGTVWRSSQVLAVRPAMGVKTMAEFVAHVKANPGKVTIASAGVGAVTHLTIELIKHEAKLNLIHVPFRSTSESLPALIGGQIDALIGDGPIIAPQVHAGTIVAIAVAAAERSPALPEVMTMAEAGYPGIVAASWFGLVVSSRTPAPIITRLQAALAEAQKDTAYQEALAKQGASAGEIGHESFARLIKADAAKWKSVIQAAGIKVE
jgi:tripartite-type tricarboxylate transporter receptor subunit TctC